MINNALNAAVAASALVSAFGITPLAYMVFDNTVPYEYNVNESYIGPAKAHAGELMVTHWTLKRINRQCPGTVTRVVVDTVNGTRITYDPVPVIDIAANVTAFERTFLLPRVITPGPKTYHVEALFHCNLLQRWFPLTERQPSLSFEVVP